MTNWRNEFRPARLGEELPNNVVRCHLSPRNCVIKDGGMGFCGVRGNRAGKLVTFNYGKGVHPTEETIETEAVNHFAPGERILSLGNIGCMMNCSYCHNWKTSQAKYVADRDVHSFTPETVVETAARHGIRCISWTYNDPVVWHEFILDTAPLAQAKGMINLYKSAFYITPEAIAELLPVIDIFSISLKSMDPSYYRKVTKGTLEPVLEAIKLVHKAGKHLEISTLMVTDLSDDEKTARDVATWVRDSLSPTVPLHFVRFHPDYRYTETTRTPIERLERNRRIALEEGIEQVYLGNVYDTPHSSTYCRGCGGELVTRYGLNATVRGLTPTGHCQKCGRDAHIRLLPERVMIPATTDTSEHRITGAQTRHEWRGDVRSAHLQLKNLSSHESLVRYRRFDHAATGAWRTIMLAPNESYRFIVAKESQGERGFEVQIPAEVTSNLHEVFDRAHFPTLSTTEAPLQGDVTPFPRLAELAPSKP